MQREKVKSAATAPAAASDGKSSEVERDREARRISQFGGSTVLAVVLIIAMMLVAFPTFVVFSIGMAPTVVAYITQLERNSYRNIAMASLNFAGVMPYILDLWSAGDKIEPALHIITDVYALFVMYGAAALAVVSFWAAPQIAASYLTVMAARRLNILRRQQEAMIQEWGADVDVSVGNGPSAAAKSE